MGRKKRLKKGDLYFKAIETIYDNWRTVLKYEVFHYADKDKLLAVVNKDSSEVKDTNYTVIVDKNNGVVISDSCDSMDKVLSCIIELQS